MKIAPKTPLALFFCDFNIDNPPDFLFNQLRQIPSDVRVFILARRTHNSKLTLEFNNIELIEYIDSKFDRFIYTFIRRFKFVRGIETIIKPHATFKLFNLLLRLKPSLVHIHGLGGPMVPILLVPLLRKVMGVKVLITHHGFSPLNAGSKLYPKDIAHIYQVDITNMPRIKASASQEVSHEFLNRDFLHSLLVKTTVFLINKANINFAISDLQADIFSRFKVRIDDVVNNTCNECSCKKLERRERAIYPKNQQVKILFLGRPIGKGLSRIVELVRNFDGAHLYIAGYADSLLYVQSVGLNPSRYTFLGYLEKSQLYPLIHHMHVIACLSECFDNFPTVAIEALYHGSVPIVTPSTGVASVLYQVHPLMVWPADSTVDVDSLHELLTNRGKIIEAIKESDVYSKLSQSLVKLEIAYKSVLNTK